MAGIGAEVGLLDKKTGGEVLPQGRKRLAFQKK